RPGLFLSAHPAQDWWGFGGCFNEMCWEALSGLTTSARQKVLLNLFSPKGPCRLRVGRLPIGASDFALQWYSHNENAGDFGMKKFSVKRDEEFLLPFIQSASKIEPSLRLYASPWSPPSWLKDPPVYNGGRLKW